MSMEIPLTVHGITEYDQDDETRTETKGVKDWKNNGQMLVLIPHSPCPKREDHGQTPISMTREGECTLNSLSDAPNPMTLNAEHRISFMLM